jgi:dTDP-4-dehydrorhamnose reductase
MSGPFAVTGARGRLGRAMVERLAAEGTALLAWSRPEFDLDRPDDLDRLLLDQRPSVVIHTAAWTDVDGCARDPDLAMRRNGTAVGALATACRRAGSSLLLVSTNEVFDGLRHDDLGYLETDPPIPANAYGASKLEGERLAAEAFDKREPEAPTTSLWIVRTAWLFGRGDPDFPRKILTAADRLEGGAALPVVEDEVGSPTYAADLASGIVALLAKAPPGLYHLVNRGSISRLGWAGRVLERCQRRVQLRPIARSAFARASSPPPWAVLDTRKAERFGVTLRGWEEAFDAYAPELCG